MCEGGVENGMKRSWFLILGSIVFGWWLVSHTNIEPMTSMILIIVLNIVFFNFIATTAIKMDEEDDRKKRFNDEKKGDTDE